MTAKDINLKRKFYKVSETDDLSDYFDYGWETLLDYKSIDWNELLDDRVVIVLGEPGIGKTFEFKQKTDDLNGQGKVAFFIRLEALASGDFSFALESPDDSNRFNEWKASSELAYFFIDSVDEARLKSAFDFGVALRKIVQAVETEVSRVSIFISCRVSNWNYSLDLNTVKSELQPLIKERDEAKKKYNDTSSKDPSDDSSFVSKQLNVTKSIHINLVCLGPLTDKQIRKLSPYYGVKDSDTFLNALEKEDLFMLAKRPLDLEWLSNYWNKNQKLGSLTEMMEANITKKLTEWKSSRPVSWPVSMVQARKGAEDLAAAMVLGQFSSILLPGAEDAPDTLSPKDVLQKWTDPEINELLNRPIFDEAPCGRLRFHHRSILEYLAASWMRRMIEAGCPSGRIQKIMLKETFGRMVAVPGMEGILGWAAGYDDNIQKNAVEAAPDLLLFFGDAKQVPVEVRMNAVRKLAERLYQGKQLDMIFQYDYRRAADIKMSKGILHIAQDYTKDEEVLGLLFNIVENGKLTQCADWALNRAMDEAESVTVRIGAIRAVGAAGDGQQKRKLAQYILKNPKIDNRLYSFSIGSLFPNNFTVNDLVSIVKKIDLKNKDASREIRKAFLYHVVPSCPDNWMDSLLETLLDFVLTVSSDSYSPRISSVSNDDIWALNPLCLLFTRYLEEVSSDVFPLNKLKKTYILINQNRHSYIHGLNELKDALTEHDQLGRELFWTTMKEVRKQVKNTTLYHYDIFDSIWTPSLKDFPWLLEDAANASNPADQKLLFDVLVGVWARNGRPKAEEEQIRISLNNGILKTKLTESLLLKLEPYKPDKYQIEHEKRQEAEREKKAKSTEDACLKLWKNLERIKSGKDFNALYDLCHQVYEMGEGGNSHWAIRNWQTLVPVFGEEIVKAAREGFKIVWKNWYPPLPCQRTGSHVENQVIVGLTGLDIAVADGLIFDHLSSEEAGIAAHYAFREMNGFPEWFEDLAAAHPQQVKSLLKTQITTEFGSEKAVESSLQGLKYGPTNVANMSVPILLDLFAKGYPKRTELVVKALDVLLEATELDIDKFSHLIMSQVEQQAEQDEIEPLITWLACWLQIDGMAAWNWVEAYLEFKAITPNPLIEKLAAHLGGYSRHNKAEWKPDYKSPKVLRRMIPILYKHTGKGVSSPTERDDAQDFSGGLPSTLANIPGPESQEALQSLAQDIDDERLSKWFNALSEKQAAKSISHQPWSTSDVARFTERYEKELKSSNELFQTISDRLEELKDDIKNGDFSERELVCLIDDEDKLQSWLAGRLKRASKGQYHVTREEEVGRKKKPDIRVSLSNGSIVTLELKPVGKNRFRYSLPSLEERLENQLVGQYMQDNNSRYGILVILMVEQKKWRLAGSGLITFEELIKKLNKKAIEIQQKILRVEGLSVVGIDCT